MMSALQPVGLRLTPLFGSFLRGRTWPYLDYVNSAHWNIKKFINPPVSNAISIFGNNNFAKVLRHLFAFIYHEMFLVWHFGNKTPFYRTLVGTDPADILYY